MPMFRTWDVLKFNTISNCCLLRHATPSAVRREGSGLAKVHMHIIYAEVFMKEFAESVILQGAWCAEVATHT